MELVDSRGIGSKPVEARVIVDRAATRESGTLYVLAVGVTEYLDGSLKLKHAAADAEAVAKGLKERGNLLFHGRLNMKTLVDKQANADQIEKTLVEMAKQAGPEDTFVLFLAGHGTTLDEEYYFMPWELEYENDDSLRKHAISQAQIRDWMARSFRRVRSFCWTPVAREALSSLHPVAQRTNKLSRNLFA